MRHFLKETDFKAEELPTLFSLAHDLKTDRGRSQRPLEYESWGLLFFKKSTRTRVSFQVGVYELGGNPVLLTAEDMQLTRGESVADTARVLSRYLHGLVVRCYGHDVIEEFSNYAHIPVVNALTDYLHPCQIYSDLLTLAERWSPGNPNPQSLKGRKLVFLGDTACNMANSWILGGALTGMEIVLAGPTEFRPGTRIDEELKLAGLSNNYVFTDDPYAAVRGADVVYTDVWVSMGMEAEKSARLEKMRPYSVTAELMAQARPDACFMHCLPAHAGEEVTQAVLDSKASIIFDEAENRLHMQKAILAMLKKFQA